MVNELQKITFIDETHGILTYIEIQQTVQSVLKHYPITYCYLFGSYAKGKAKESSDVDLIVSSEVDGLQFCGLVEELREALHKIVDLLSSNQLTDNHALIDEVLKTGVKIYDCSMSPDASHQKKQKDSQNIKIRHKKISS